MVQEMREDRKVERLVRLLLLDEQEVVERDTGKKRNVMVVDTRERDKCARVDDADHTLDELGGGARGIGFDRGYSKEINRGGNDEKR